MSILAELKPDALQLHEAIYLNPRSFGERVDVDAVVTEVVEKGPVTNYGLRAS